QLVEPVRERTRVRVLGRARGRRQHERRDERDDETDATRPFEHRNLRFPELDVPCEPAARYETSSVLIPSFPAQSNRVAKMADPQQDDPTAEPPPSEEELQRRLEEQL